MELTHRFTVPTGVDQTWSAFNDIEGVAGCFPGAVVTSVEADSFQGSCKVKLGPIALVYNGSGTFVDKDESTHTMRIEAKGKDKRGNGTAGAHVTATMTAAVTGGATDVEVVTDLNITGKPAQFGRGVMQDVSDKLLGQFVACLEQKLGGAAEKTPTTEGTIEKAPGVEPVPPEQDQASATSSQPPEPTPKHGAPSRPVASAAPVASKHAATPASDDALDLGATVLPVLARTYWKQALGVVLGLLLVVRVLRRRRG